MVRDVTLTTRMATWKCTRLPSRGQTPRTTLQRTNSSYMERVELFFAANVADAKKVPVLLSLIGSKTYGLLRNLISPSSPAEKKYKAHFEPKPIVIVERFHFHRRTQAVGESISEYWLNFVGCRPIATTSTRP